MSIFSVGGSSPSEGFELKSARFEDGSSSYLSSTPPIDSANGRKTWTLSWWEKKAFPNNGYVYSQGTSGNSIFIGPNSSNGELWVREITSSSADVFGWKVDSYARDPAAWYHFVVAVDTTQVTSTDRVKIYINGVQQTLTAAGGGAPSLNLQTELNNNTTRYIGTWKGSSPYKDGYLAEFYLLDGTALTPASFGETNAGTNQWQPINPTDIKPTLTFGTNGFYLPFSNDALAASFTDSAEKFATAGGAAHTDTTVKKWGTASAQFNGSSSYLTVPDSSDWNMFANTSDSQTLDYWVNHTSVSSGQIYFMPREDGSNYWYIRHMSGTDITLYGKISNSVFINQTATAFSNTGAWHHIALVKIANKIGVYVDGNQIIYTTFSTTRDFAAVFNIGSQDGSSDFYNGYMDEVRWSDSNVFNADPNVGTSDTITVPTGAFTADSNTKLLLHMDGADNGTSFPDSSESAGRHTITANGNVTNTRVSNHPVTANNDAHIIGPKIGSSAIAFDGDEDFLSVPDSDDWDFAAGSYTVDFWANAGTTAWEDDAFFWTQWEDSNNFAGLRIRTNGDVNLLLKKNSIYLVNIDFTSVTMPLQQWFHFALVKDVSSGDIMIFIDGKKQQTVNNTQSWPGLTGSLLIGDDNYNADKEFTGYMDEFRWSKGIARWTADFTPPTAEYVSDSYTKLLIHSNTTMGSTTFTDSSSGAHTITANGDVMNVAPKIGTGMAAFDGTTDALNAGDSNGFSFGSGEFTLESWVCFDNVTQSATIIEKYDETQTIKEYKFQIHTTGVDYGIEFGYSSDGSARTWLQFAWQPVVDTWYHVAVSRDSSGDIRAFVDGTQIGSTQNVTASFYSSTAPLVMGANYNNGSIYSTGNLAGYMDEVRISRTARYTSTFIPSTTAFKDDKDTVLLLHMDGGGGIDPDTNLPTLPGQGTYFWDASTNAIFYDSATGVPTNKSIIHITGASGDYLSIPDSSDWDLGTGDFTIETWMNPIYVRPSDSNTLMYAGGSTWPAAFRLVYGAALAPIIQLEGTYYSFGDGLIGIGTWQHLAASREGTNLRCYFNGVLVATYTVSTDIQNSGTLYIGKRGDTTADNAYDYMDQIRISNNARYSLPSFAAPVAAYSNDSNTKLLLHCDGSNGGTTFTDSSGSPHTVTAVGSAHTDTAIKKFGTASGQFTASNDADGLTVPDSADWAFGGNDFTIDFQVYFNSTSAVGQSGTTLVNQWKANGVIAAWALQNNSGTPNRWHFYYSTNGVNGAGSIYWDYTFSTSTWYHVAFMRRNNSMAMIVNGVIVAVNIFTDTIADVNFNLQIGGYMDTLDDYYLDGYMDEIRISNTARYDLSSFTPATTPFTADANTHLLVQSDFSEGGLGADHSNNYNYFTPTNLTADDMMLDSPMNNFATLNPLMPSAATYLSEGNLRNNPGGAAWSRGVSTFGATSGKWYFEIYVGAMGTNGAIGIRNDVGLWDQTGGPPGYCEYGPETGGQLYRDGLTTISTVGVFAAGDIISIAVNMDDNEIQWFKNNAVLGGSGNVPLALPASTQNGFVTYGAANTDDHRWNFGQDSSFAGTKTAQGNQDGNDKGDFFYAPPTGFLALCTDNLSDPLISGVDAPKNFNTVLYAGDNATTNSITGVGFQSDFTWIKNRTSSCDHVLFDVVRGVANTTAGKQISSNLTAPEPSNTNGHITSFNSDGFSLRDGTSGAEPRLNTNKGSTNYVSWNWKAGGTAVSNTDGTITSSVSANPTAGNSIVGYTGTGSAATIGHGLSQAPDMVFVKNRTAAAESWVVSIGNVTGTASEYLVLNSDIASQTDTSQFPSAPGSSVVSIGATANINVSTQGFIAYCFHSIEGYSKVGSYVGNGNADGTFVYTGFRPSWFLWKNSTAAGGWWGIIDNKRLGYNVDNNPLYPTVADAAYSTDVADIVSNGIKIRHDLGNINQSGQTIIYLAFAESPFKTSNAR